MRHKQLVARARVQARSSKVAAEREDRIDARIAARHLADLKRSADEIEIGVGAYKADYSRLTDEQLARKAQDYYDAADARVGDTQCYRLGSAEDIAANTPKRKRLLETISEVRKHYPICTGLIDYFPDACAAVAEVSYQGNQKHNPGEPMHHSRGKSMDHADCIARHLAERGGFDGGIRHTAALAWRAMALLQEELEQENDFPLPRGAKA